MTRAQGTVVIAAMAGVLVKVTRLDMFSIFQISILPPDHHQPEVQENHHVHGPHDHTYKINIHNQGFIQGGGKPGISPPPSKSFPPQAEVPLPPRTAHQIELLDSFVMGTLCPLEDELCHVY